MGRYLDILRQAEAQGCDISDISDKSDKRVAEAVGEVPEYGFGRFGRFSRTFAALESRCPKHVPVERWQQAVADGRRFMARRGKQAEALGWTARDLFGLHIPPAKPHPSYSRLSRYDETGLIWLLQGRPVVALTAATAASSYSRLSRYDETGLIWLLQGRPVVALTAATAAIQNSTGAITIYRRT
jgi:hypothetical protein